MGLFTTLEKLESRQSATDDFWYVPARLGVASGIDVSPDNALELTGVWAAVNVIAGTIATLPLKLLRRRADGGKELAHDHPLFDILHRRPNPWQTTTSFLEMGQGHLLLRGNSYSEIIRNRAEQIRELVPLHPERVEVFSEGRNIRYLYRLTSGGQRALTQRDMLHIHGLSSNGVTGLGPVTLMREAVGLALAEERYGARFFGNDARPGGVLKHPGILDDEARKNLKKSWNEAHQGAAAHTVAILEEGLEWQQVGVSSEDSQFLQSRQFQISEIARIFNIPPHKLRDLTRSTFSNIEQQSIEFVVDTIRPWLVRWEQQMELSLLTENERESLFIKFSVDALLRGDNATRSAFYRELFGIGAFSINDIRELEDRNPVEGGDQRFVALNMIPITAVASQSDRTLISQKIERRDVTGRRQQQIAFRGVFLDAAQRLVKRETQDLRRLIRGTGQLGEKFTRFYEDFPQVVRQILGPAVLTYGEAISQTAADEVGTKLDGAAIAKFAADYIEALAARHVKSSRGQLNQVVADITNTRQLPETLDEELEAALDERLDEWLEKRPNKIAERETVQGGAAFAKAVWVAAGVASLVWIASGDACPLCSSLDGRIVSIRSDFVSAGGTVEGEGTAPLTVTAGIGQPQLHEGCECMIGPG